MATRNRSIVDEFANINTVPAIAGIGYAVAAAVQFLDTSFTVGAFDYTFEPTHALVVSLVMLVVAFAASDTRDFRYYTDVEKAAIAGGVLLLVGNEYITSISDFIVENEPTAGLFAFVVVMGAWVVVAR